MLFLRPFCRYCLFLGSLYPFQRAIRAVFRLFFRFFRLSPCFGRLFPSIFLRLARFPASVRFPVHKNIICKDTVRGGTFCPFSFPRSLTLAAQSPQATRGGADHAAPRRSLIPSSRLSPFAALYLHSLFAHAQVLLRSHRLLFTALYRLPFRPYSIPIIYCARARPRAYIFLRKRGHAAFPSCFPSQKKKTKRRPQDEKRPIGAQKHVNRGHGREK